MKNLIINADDFGYSKVFNTEILRLLESGLVSSTTVMINWVTDKQDAQVKELIELNKSHNISVGLHLEFSDTNFSPEIKRQHEKFVDTFTFEPSHIDLHKSTYLNEADSVIAAYCNENNLPRRNHRTSNIEMDTTTSNPVLNGTNKSFDELKSVIENFKDDESNEILFHPGKYDLDCKSSLNKQREDDVRKIEEIQPFLEKNNIKLISFHDLAK